MKAPDFPGMAGAKMTRMAESTIRLLGPPAIESTGSTPPQPQGPQGLGRAGLPCAAAGRHQPLPAADAAVPGRGGSTGCPALEPLRAAPDPRRRVLDGDPLRLALQPPWRCDAVELVGRPTVPSPDPRLSTASCWRVSPSPIARFSIPGWRTSATGWRTAPSRLLYEASLAALASGAAGEAAELASRALRGILPRGLQRRAGQGAVALGEHRRAREHVTKCADLTARNWACRCPRKSGVPCRMRSGRPTRGSRPPWPPSGPISTPAAPRSRRAPSTGGWISCGSPSSWPSAPPTAHLLAESLVTLSGALIHQAGGRGAEVADFLHRALSAEAPDVRLPDCRRRLPRAGLPVRAAGRPGPGGRLAGPGDAAAEGFPDEQAQDPGDPGHAGIGYRPLRGRRGCLDRVR